MGKRKGNAEARRAWVQANGPIGKDSNGFTLEVHHKDGDSSNNNIDNLSLLTIQEHLQAHMENGDWGAAALIAKRIGKGPDYIRNIQLGKKRPGVGGAPKGRVPWNKGKKACFSEDVIDRMRVTRSGKRFGRLKVSDEVAAEIIELYNQRLPIAAVGEVCKNGKVMTYETAFAKTYCERYGVTSAQIRNIILGKRRVISSQR